MTGTIVTFYSYKGGVGRSLALANTAAVLARWGYRVLCVDWDLDAPGLGFYLRPWLADDPPVGLVDIVEDLVAGGEPDPDAYAVPVSLPGADGRLDLLSAGSTGERYVRQAQEIDWAGLYRRHDFGAFLERCRTRWKDAYDFVLVDSRTGITDIGGICTTQLPEVLVMLFTANQQSVRGTLDVARRAALAHDALPYDRGGLLFVPVLSRFDGRTEYDQAAEWQRRVVADMASLVRSWADRGVPVDNLFVHLTVPYVAKWSFGEQLPAVAEPTPNPELISYSLETVAALIAQRLGRTGRLAENRDSYVAAAARAGLRASADARYDVFISSGDRDRELAETIARALIRRSLRVFLPSLDVAYRDSFSPMVVEALTNATNLLVVVGAEFGPGQLREVDLFLQQILDEGSDRLVIPVLAPRVSKGAVPSILRQFRAERLLDDSPKGIMALSHRVARDVAVSGSVAAPGRSSEVREDALDTVAGLSHWRLDPLRWQLVALGVDKLGLALDSRDDDAIRVATADLELVGPVRGVGSGGDATDMPAELRASVTELIERLGG